MLRGSWRGCGAAAGVGWGRHGLSQGAGRVSDAAVRRRVGAWRSGGLVASRQFWANTPATVWLTSDGMTAAGLAWRASVPTHATVAAGAIGAGQRCGLCPARWAVLRGEEKGALPPRTRPGDRTGQFRLVHTRLFMSIRDRLFW